MKIKNKGFTLIELLAVPTILNIVKESKEESNKESVENYISAVEQAFVRKSLTQQFVQ